MQPEDRQSVNEGKSIEDKLAGMASQGKIWRRLLWLRRVPGRNLRRRVVLSADTIKSTSGLTCVETTRMRSNAQPVLRRDDCFA